MALRLVNKRLPVSFARLGQAPVAVIQRQGSQYSVRYYSDKNVDPKQRATSIIDALPGNSIISKTGILTVGTGLAAFAISKELYVLNEETLLVVSFSTLIYYIAKLMREPYADWAEGHINRVKDVLSKARDEHTSAVKTRIDSVQQMKDVVDITKNLFEVSKETAKLEAEAFELQQKNAVATEIKSVLDSWVRYETQVREREQSDLAKKLIEKIRSELSDPKLKNQILQQSIQDIEKLVQNKSL